MRLRVIFKIGINIFVRVAAEGSETPPVSNHFVNADGLPVITSAKTRRDDQSYLSLSTIDYRQGDAMVRYGLSHKSPRPEPIECRKSRIGLQSDGMRQSH